MYKTPTRNTPTPTHEYIHIKLYDIKRFFCRRRLGVYLKKIITI